MNFHALVEEKVKHQALCCAHPAVNFMMGVVHQEIPNATPDKSRPIV